MGLSTAVPMVVWMRVIGCGWREGLAMATAMLLPWAVVLVLCAAGFADQLPWLNGFAGTAMLLGMLAFMLYRWRHYARPMGIIPMWASHRFAVRAGRAPEVETM